MRRPRARVPRSAPAAGVASPGAAPTRVLLMGFRLGALEAAERLGLELLVVHEREIPAEFAARVPRSAPARLRKRAEVERAVRELAPAGPVSAVVAASEGGVLAAAWARELLGLPGNGVAASERCSDKLLMKRAAAAHGVRCAEWLAPGGARAGELLRTLGLPLVLKRARSSGGRGMVFAADEAEAVAALPSCDLVERFVYGDEMSVETFLVDGCPLFVNLTHYLVRSHANVLPAELPAAERAAVLDLNARVLRAMGLECGMTHLELFRTRDGLVFGEIAARPPGGRIVQLLRRAWGFDAWEALLAIELGRPVAFPSVPRTTAGVWMLHPGEGEVLEVGGLARVLEVPGVSRVRLRIAAGDHVALREGLGQDVGYLEASGPDQASVSRALLAAHAALEIRMRR